MGAILELNDVVKYFPIPSGGVISRRYNTCKALDGISFSLNKGSCLGIAGESGSGKSTLARLILLIEHTTSGSIIYKGKDIQTLTPRDIIWYRNEIQTVFQDVGGSLSPRMRIRDIVSEPLEVHRRRRLSRVEIKAKLEKTLSNVGLGSNILDRFPHEVSGGQKQRVAIARAIILKPSLLILDEPVCALDVSVRGQILNLLLDLQEQHELTYIIISHDLTMFRHLVDEIAIIYLGKIVEMGTTEEIFQKPAHPYTRALLAAVPQPIPGREKTVTVLADELTDPIDPPSGCRFQARCALSFNSLSECVIKPPELRKVGREHYVACHQIKSQEEKLTDRS
jgi:oligopeptide/dipeptide ABC transporter ATP-binding protein